MIKKALSRGELSVVSPELELVDFVGLADAGADLKADFIPFFGAVDVHTVDLHRGDQLGKVSGVPFDLDRVSLR